MTSDRRPETLVLNLTEVTVRKNDKTPPILTDGTGTAGGTPIATVAVGKFAPGNLPVREQEYDISGTVDRKTRINLRAKCEYSGETSEFKRI